MRNDLPAQLRLCEWARINHTLPGEVCRDIDAAADAWRKVNALPASPVSFVGPDGRQLCARQYVGVIEVGDVAIEIYPKLDAALIEVDERPLGSTETTGTVMRNLLWMLEVANHRDLAETATAHLEEAPTSFFDLFAYLLGKNLLPELERGVAHAYVRFADDLRAVRGRIGLVEQVTRNWNRLDRVFCAWDEFTPDTAINRLLKCACGFLAQRVKYLEAARLLLDCQTLLSEAEDVSPTTALREVGNLRFDRSVERFKTAFDLARRLLAGVGHNLGVGSANYLGTLFCIHPGGISQRADYYWPDGPAFWIGDAKYKHLAKGKRQSLRFSDLASEENDGSDDSALAGRVLSASDVRQLTVYAELVRRREQIQAPPNLMLLYPFVGTAQECLPDNVKAWNGSAFWLMPVKVMPLDFVGDAIQFS